MNFLTNQTPQNNPIKSDQFSLNFNDIEHTTVEMSRKAKIPECNVPCQKPLLIRDTNRVEDTGRHRVLSGIDLGLRQLSCISTSSPQITHGKEPAKDAFHARSRAKREASNRTHSRSTSDNSSSKPNRNKGSNDPIPLKPIEKSTLRTFFVSSSVNGVVIYPSLRFDGSAYSNSADYQSSQLDNIRCVKSGPGYYTVSSDEDENILCTQAEPLIRVVVLGAYMYRDNYGKVIHQGLQTFHVLTPYYHLITKTLCAPEVNQSLLNGLLALTARNTAVLSLVDPQLVSSTNKYFLAVLHCRKYKDFGDTSLSQKMMKNGGAIGDGSLGHISSLTTLGVTQHLGCFIKVPHVSLDFEGYAPREDFQVTQSSIPVWEGIPKFDEDQPDPATYKTQMFAFRGSDQVQGHVFAKTNQNFNHALKRTFGQRDGETGLRQNALSLGLIIARKLGGKYIALEGKMRNGRLYSNHTRGRYYIAQCMLESFRDIGRHRLQVCSDQLSTTFGWAYSAAYLSFTEVMATYVSRSYVTEIPHAKRALRRRFYNGEYLHADEYTLVKHVDLFLKGEEIAKAGKRGRVVASYGKGAIYAGELPEYAKVNLDGDSWYFRNGITYLCRIVAKPKSGYLEELGEMLKQAVCTPDFLFTASYGDDNVAAGMVNGESFAFNTDISSNDAGQDVPAFLVVNRIISEFSSERADGLVEQCMKPMRVRAPQGDDYFIAQFDGPVEGSGTSLTTALNCAGSKMGNIGFFYHLTEGVPPQEAVRLGFLEVGHLITIDDDFGSVDLLSGFQFLKKSFFVASGGIVSYTNFGAIFRGFGSCDSDLDHIKLSVSLGTFNLMCNEERMELFIGNVVRGYKNEPSSCIMDALRKRFSNGSADVLTDYDVHVGGSKDHSSIILPNEFICARYGTTDSELSDIVNAITELQLGDVISLSGIAKFLSKDYGY